MMPEISQKNSRCVSSCLCSSVFICVSSAYLLAIRKARIYMNVRRWCSPDALMRSSPRSPLHAHRGDERKEDTLENDF